MSRATTHRGGAVGVLALTVVLHACSADDTPTSPPRVSRPNASTALTTFVVTNTNDDGPGSLRAALEAIEEGKLIQFDPSLAGQTITLLSGPLDPYGGTSHVIEGPPNGGITINGGNNFIVIGGGSRDLTLRNMTITGGRPPAGGVGGGINFGGKSDLTLENVLVTGNAAERGGGLYVTGGASLLMLNSTVSGNTATGEGGGIYNTGSMRLTNSTVTGNTAAGGGGVAYQGHLALHNSIVANNTATSSANCAPLFDAIQSYFGTNLSSDASCGAHANLIVADPKLGALANNGGPTRTHPLLKESPAIDGAPDCPAAVDQRYVARPQGAKCDIGAFEFNDYITVGLTIDPSGTINPATGSTIVSGSVTCSAATSVDLAVALKQTQKARRGTAVVEASGTVTIECAGQKFWSIALKPASGSFLNAAAAATVQNVNVPKYAIPAKLEGAVKLFWSK